MPITVKLIPAIALISFALLSLGFVTWVFIKNLARRNNPFKEFGRWVLAVWEIITGLID